jgi:hypothetical protein
MKHMLSLLLAITATAGDLQLTLPPVVYATPDVQMSLYHDNLVLTETPEKYRFEITSKLGKSEALRWTVKPSDSDVGDHAIEVKIKDASDTVLESGRTTLHVSPRKSGEGKSLRLLIVGDSLTHATIYPNEIANLLSRPGNPKWTMLGTHHPASALPTVNHEGYGGWKWAGFLTKFTAPTPGVTAGPLAGKSTSPFIFPSADGKTGVFDLPRYFKEHCDGVPPDVVTFLLGINDCFGADPNNPDKKINEVLDQADKLLAEFHKAAPKALLAVGLTTPPNSRQAGFTANYKDKYPRWGWKRIQHRLVQRMLERLSGRESEGIHLVPTELNLDPVDGYPVNNGVHPNPTGYAQIGASFYSWMKSRL